MARSQSVQPAHADDGLRVYYAGADGSVKTALELAEFTFVTDPMQADVFVLNGEVPTDPAIARRIQSGQAGLVLIMGENIRSGYVTALMGIPVTVEKRDTALSLTPLDGVDDLLLQDIVWDGAPQIRERYDVVMPMSSVQPLVTGYEDGSWVLWSAHGGRGFILNAFLGDETNPQIQEWAYFYYLIYHLVERAAGRTPLSFAEYPVSPVPHAAERNMLWVALRTLPERLARAKIAYLYIAPSAIIMAIITVGPLLFQFYMAFTDYAIKHLRKNNPSFVGVDNFVQIATNQTFIENFDFWRILTFDLVWTFSNIFIHVITGIILALILNYKGLIAKKLYRALYMIPWVMPGLIVAVVWRNMFDKDFGAINQLLSIVVRPLYDAGLIPALRQVLLTFPFLTDFANGIPLAYEAVKIRWLTHPDPIVDIASVLVLPLSYFAVLIVNSWLGWPFMMTVATGALQSIPLELYEAARVDGANRWQQFWGITAPLLRPAMVPAIMLSIIWTFNQFNVIYFVSEGGPFGMTEILVTQAFKLVNPQGKYGLASAFNIIVFLILLVITLITNRISRATEAYYV